MKRQLHFPIRWAAAGLVACLFSGIFSGCSRSSAPLESISSPRGTNWITSLPFTIDEPGDFALASDLTGTPHASGIIIAASNVNLDLNGKTLSGAPRSTAGIMTRGSLTNITVRNGRIENWGHAAVEASFVSSSEFSGLTILSNALGLSVNVSNRISQCVSAYNGGIGISALQGSVVTECESIGNRAEGMTVGYGSVVANCLLSSNLFNGLFATHFGTVSNTIAVHNGFSGIVAGNSSSVTDCVASHNGRDGIEAGNGCTVSNSHAHSNLVHGVSVFGHSTVQNCQVTGNKRDGIRTGFNGRILHNHCMGNGSSGADTANIHLVLQRNRVEGNQIEINGEIGIRASHPQNQIIQNVVRRGERGGTAFECSPQTLDSVLNRPPAPGDPHTANYEF